MKLISLNIEGAKHWNLVDPFLKSERADVICLQEVFKKDAERAAETLGMQTSFAPMFLRPYGEPAVLEQEGIAILSRSPMRDVAIRNYHVPAKDIVLIDETDGGAHINTTVRRSLLSTTIENDEGAFTIATTHFTWTPDGMPRDYQYGAAENLLKALEAFPDVALCGDFNVPRGVNDIYERFAAKYSDVIPPDYASSLDLTLRRPRTNPETARRLAGYMVDYLFLSAAYRAVGVRLAPGVSDHYAIVADLRHAA